MEILGLSLDDTYPAAEGDLAYLVFYNQGKTLTASSDEIMKIAVSFAQLTAITERFLKTV